MACCLSESTLGTSYKNSNSTKQTIKTPGFYLLKHHSAYMMRSRPGRELPQILKREKENTHTYTNTLKYNQAEGKKGCGAGAAEMAWWLRALAAPTEAPGSVPSTHSGISLPSPVPALRNLVPASGLREHWIHMVHMQTLGHTHICMIKLFKKMN